MVKHTKYLLARERRIARETPEEAAAAAAAAAAAKAKAEADAKAAKTFTQEDVDRIVGQRVAKTRETMATLEAEIATLKVDSEQRKTLESRLSEVTKTLATEKQLAEEKIKKEKDEADKKIKDLETEKVNWENRYKTEKVESDLMSAASAANAFSPPQIVKLLKDDTKIVQDVDAEGKPTGRMITKVVFRDVKENKPVELELTPQEAIQRMVEKPETYGNLFKTDKTKGLGLMGDGDKAGANNPDKPPTGDQASYEEWRKKNAFR